MREAWTSSSPESYVFVSPTTLTPSSSPSIFPLEETNSSSTGNHQPAQEEEERLNENKENSRWVQKLCRRLPDSEDILSDIIAGLTVAVFNVPQAMAYAGLAQLPPIYGLYTSLAPTLIYALLGNAPQITLGVYSIICIMTGTVNGRTASDYDAEHESRIAPPFQGYYQSPILPDYVLQEITTSLTFYVIASALRFDLIVEKLLDGYVVDGFTTAAVIHSLVAQLARLFGMQTKAFSGTLSIYDKLKDILVHFLEFIHVHTTILSIAAISFIYIASFAKSRMSSKVAVYIPIDLLLLIVSTFASYVFHLEVTGVKVVGSLPVGYIFTIYRAINHFPMDVFSIAAVAIAVTFTIKKRLHDEPAHWRELFALGTSNVFGAFFGSIPASGSFSRTFVCNAAGAKTRLTGITSVLATTLVLLWAAPLLYHLPMVTILKQMCATLQAVLSCIVVHALAPLLLPIFQIREKFEANPSAALTFLVTFLATLVFELFIGLIIGLLFALVVKFLKREPPFDI